MFKPRSGGVLVGKAVFIFDSMDEVTALPVCDSYIVYDNLVVGVRTTIGFIVVDRHLKFKSASGLKYADV